MNFFLPGVKNSLTISPDISGGRVTVLLFVRTVTGGGQNKPKKIIVTNTKIHNS